MFNNFSDLEIYLKFKNSKLLTTKGNSYFWVYDELFSKFKSKKITFVEVGVKWGGSLFMWREFFGKNARIIGIDLDPNAKKLEKHGFEIFIGDQSSKLFWKNFFYSVGNIDVLLDDGGHTNENQILTLFNCVNFINNDGLIVIEDTISNYDSKFYNPQKYSFINF